MRKAIVSLALLLTVLTARAQDYSFITEMPDDFASIDTVAPPKQFKSIHMVGVKYGVNLSGISTQPSLRESRVLTYNNISVLYTYYHALWDKLFNFGLQTGLKHGYEGYASELSGYGEICEMVEVPLISQFKIDFSIFRLLVDVGAYGGYRLSTDREGGFDRYDQRYDYGIVGGAGIAVVFNPFEIQLEGCYKRSFASMYHTNKYSDIYWMFTYPTNIMFSASLFVHLW